MSDDERRKLLGFTRSLGRFQEGVQKSGYSLIGAIMLLGGLGYLFDSWRDTAPWGLVTGLLLGLVVGFYELAKAVWHR
jgi:F0F1-type ATP synthase assembly protein I